MSTEFKRLIPGETVEASVHIGYTASTSRTAQIHKLTFVNRTAGDVTITVYLVPSGQSVSNDYLIANQRTVPANDAWSPPDAEGQVVEAGGTIQYFSDTPDALNAICSGVEVTV